MHNVLHELIYPSINLAILLAIVVVKLREPLRDFVRGRHDGLRDELQRVRELLGLAQGKHQEFTSKLKAMDAEAASLRDQARAEAAATRSRILAEAQKLSASIVSDARASAQGLHSQLRSELLAVVGSRVLDRAEAILRERLTAEDRGRIRHEFALQLEAAP